MRIKPEVRKWYSKLGKKGGSVSSLEKTEAARRNGKLGGRGHTKAKRQTQETPIKTEAKFN